MSTNYPILSLTDAAGNVHYGRTYNWSSTGLPTDNAVVSIEFTLPASVSPGSQYALVLIATGIASDPIAFYRPVCVRYGLSNPGDGTYASSYNRFALATNAVRSGRTILFKYPGSTPERPTISKPMTVGAGGGFCNHWPLML